VALGIHPRKRLRTLLHRLDYGSQQASGRASSRTHSHDQTPGRRTESRGESPGSDASRSASPGTQIETKEESAPRSASLALRGRGAQSVEQPRKLSGLVEGFPTRLLKPSKSPVLRADYGVSPSLSQWSVIQPNRVK